MNQPNFSEDENRDDELELPPLDGDEWSNVDTSHSESGGTKIESEAVESPLEPLDDTPILAELVQPEPLQGTPINYAPNNPYAEKPRSHRYVAAPPLDLTNELHNMACIGGAVGAVVLGAWTILCSLITQYAAINGVLAILLGIYGWNSPRRQLAIVGMSLGLVGMLMSMMNLNEALTR